MSITYTTGTRVELYPATDAWMRGDRFGEIIAVTCRRGHVRYRVKMDRSGRVLTVAQGNIQGGC
jgi:hypothetical protein